MINPFIYGKVVQGDDFFDRVQERGRLLQLLQGKNHVLVTGDRRIGKTSLLLTCFEELEKQDIPTFYFNLDPITKIDIFLERYGTLFTRKTAWASRALQILKTGLKGFKLDIELDEKGSPAASLNWEGKGSVKAQDIQEILLLPQRLAHKNKQRFVICFDEFQVSQAISGVDLVAEMRTSFQEQPDVTYIFMGSEMSVLDQLFSSPREKFFNSATKFHVGPISRDDFIQFMKKQFSKRGLSLSHQTGDLLCQWAHDVPAHIQHLCSCLWDLLPSDEREITPDRVQGAVLSDIESRGQFYLQIWQTIGDEKDKLILRRLATAGDLAVSSPEFCLPLSMNPATATRRLRKMVAKTRGAVIHQRSTGYVFSDPFFEEWVRQKT